MRSHNPSKKLSKINNAIMHKELRTFLKTKHLILFDFPCPDKFKQQSMKSGHVCDPQTLFVWQTDYSFPFGVEGVFIESQEWS